MALPSITAPDFVTTIPSTGQEIAYRPFLVKEEKLLLMAMEGDDDTEIQRAIVKILDECILTEGVDVSKLAVFDVEFLFLKLRGKSVGEVVELKLGHRDSDCTAKTDVAINLEEIPVNVLPEGLKATTLGELDARNRVGVNVVGLKKSDGDFVINPDRDTPLDDACKLFVLGTVDQIRTLNRLLGIQPPQV